MEKFKEWLVLTGLFIVAIITGLLNWWVLICFGIIIADLIALVCVPMAIVFISLVFLITVSIILIQIFIQ